MAESVGYRLGRWFGRLPAIRKLLVVGAIVLGLMLLFSSITSGGGGSNQTASPPAGDSNSGASSTASCTTLAQADVNKALQGWTGSGTLTVTSALKVPSSGSDVFTEVWYIKGSAPGIDSEVFVFANDPGGLLVGADFVTREFFDWGAAAASGSPMDVAARDTVDAAPTCLS